MRLYFWKQPNKNRERPQLVRCHVHSRFFYFVKSLNLPALTDTLTEFYSAKTITTENIDVSITEAKEATLNGKSVGLVNCKATISGTRDGIDFQNIYDLSLLLSYDTDPVGIYVVKSIAKE